MKALPPAGCVRMRCACGFPAVAATDRGAIESLDEHIKAVPLVPGDNGHYLIERTVLRPVS